MANPILALFPWSVIEKCYRRNGKPKLLICQICKQPYKRKNRSLACSTPCHLQVAFWQRVEKTENCWHWRGSKTRFGYGIFTDTSIKKMWSVHRFAYESIVGPIPEGLTLDHLCRNKLCVNPAHLEPVTSGENTLRGNSYSGRNRRKTHCPHGHSYDAENTRVSKEGFRRCRACGRIHGQEQRARKRLARISADGNNASALEQTTET